MRGAPAAAGVNWNPDANPQQNVTTVKAEHIRQLRTKLAEALNALHLPVGGYEHPTLTENESPIYAVDFQELRTKIKDAWAALSASSALLQAYDGDGLRVKKTEYGWSTFYLRSSVLGGQVISEIGVSASGGTAAWQRGYVYAGSSLMAVQQQGGVFWTYEDPVTKSKRVTDVNGTTVSAIETDPWGADTNRSFSQAFQPRKYTTYDRDSNGSDEAMFRRYNRKDSRFVQPDPYEGSYSLTDAQSFNRYAYVQNDPVNFTDPSGLDPDDPRNRWDPSDVVRVYTLDRRPGGGDNSLLFYRGVSGLGERFSRMLYDPGASGRDLIPQEPQNPYDMRQIMRDNRTRQQTMEQARKEFNDCVNKDPNVAEYKKRYGDAKVDFSWLYGGISRNAVKAGMAGTTAVLVSKTNVFTNVLYLIVLPDLMYADKNKALKELLDVSRPVIKDCAKQVNEKFGFKFNIKL